MTAKEELLSCLRNFPGVSGEPEIEGESLTWLRVETKTDEDIEAVVGLPIRLVHQPLATALLLPVVAVILMRLWFRHRG